MSKSDWCNIKVSVPWRSTGHYRDLRVWLIENVVHGCYHIQGSDFDNISHRVIYFAHKQDAVQFALRWA